jgi:protoporphyrinogen/coproporphyrinogen III oxidase
MTVVVVGAGLAGLSAAWQLRRAGADVTVLESERRAGGVVVTERRDGFVVEGGPDSWLASEPDISDLARELGLNGRLVKQSAAGSRLWNGKALERLEEGEAAALLGIHARPESLRAGFSTFAAGMGELTESLAAGLGERLRTPLGVSGLTPGRSGWRLAVTGGAVVEAEAVVLALPAYAAARLLETAGAWGARALAEVVYFPSLTVSLAYRVEQVGKKLEGTGYVARPGTGASVRAVTYASQKFPGRSPLGHLLFRAFLGPVEGEPGAVAHAHLREVLSITGEPLWTRAFFLSRAIPRYSHHHTAHVVEVRRRLDRLPPVAIAGAGYDGTGVSACVRSGRAAGSLVATRLSA